MSPLFELAVLAATLSSTLAGWLIAGRRGRRRCAELTQAHDAALRAVHGEMATLAGRVHELDHGTARATQQTAELLAERQQLRESLAEL